MDKLIEPNIGKLGETQILSSVMRTFSGHLWSAVMYLAILDANHYQNSEKNDCPSH